MQNRCNLILFQRRFVFILGNRFQDAFRNTIGQRETERALQLGLLYSPADALKVGLVDEITSQEQVMSTTYQHVETYLEIPGTNAGLLLYWQIELINNNNLTMVVGFSLNLECSLLSHWFSSFDWIAYCVQGTLLMKLYYT